MLKKKYDYKYENCAINFFANPTLLISIREMTSVARATSETARARARELRSVMSE